MQINISDDQKYLLSHVPMGLFLLIVSISVPLMGGDCSQD